MPEAPSTDPYASPRAAGPVEKPRPHRFLHRAVMVLLVLNAAIAVLGKLRSFEFIPDKIFALLMAAGIWGLILWKMGQRPRGWGLPIGVFLFLVTGLQIYFWLKWTAVATEQRMQMADTSMWLFFLALIPVVLSAAGCILLRFRWPVEEKAGG